MQFNTLTTIKETLTVNDIFLITSDNWLDWITVFGYLAFTGFIIWRILAAK